MKLAQAVVPITNTPSTLKELEIVFASIVRSLLALAGAVFFVMLIVGGYKYITSGGDPKKTAEAQGTLTWAIGGLVFVALAYLILRFVAVFTGVNSILNFEIPQ